MKAARDVPCGSCRHCCQNELLLLHPEDGDDPSNYHVQAVTSPVTGKPALALQHQKNGDCIYLGPTGCTIHGRAPVLCRSFDCRLFYLRLMDLPRPHRRRLAKQRPEIAAQMDVGRRTLAEHPL